MAFESNQGWAAPATIALQGVGPAGPGPGQGDAAHNQCRTRPGARAAPSMPASPQCAPGASHLTWRAKAFTPHTAPMPAPPTHASPSHPFQPHPPMPNPSTPARTRPPPASPAHAAHVAHASRPPTMRRAGPSAPRTTRTAFRKLRRRRQEPPLGLSTTTRMACPEELSGPSSRQEPGRFQCGPGVDRPVPVWTHADALATLAWQPTTNRPVLVPQGVVEPSPIQEEPAWSNRFDVAARRSHLDQLRAAALQYRARWVALGFRV